MSTLYDVGGIFGGAAGGWISDRLDGKRSPVVVVMLVLGIAALFFYEGFGTSPLANGILMSIAGTIGSCCMCVVVKYWVHVYILILYSRNLR
jgi:sugar phosphate permease